MTFILFADDNPLFSVVYDITTNTTSFPKFLKRQNNLTEILIY